MFWKQSEFREAGVGTIKEVRGNTISLEFVLALTLNVLNLGAVSFGNSVDPDQLASWRTSEWNPLCLPFSS